MRTTVPVNILIEAGVFRIDCQCGEMFFFYDEFQTHVIENHIEGEDVE